MCQEVFLRHWDTEFHVNLENMSASNFIPFSRAISSGNLPDLSWIWRASIDPGWSSRYVASWENPRRAERWSNVSWPGDEEIDGKSYKLLVQQSKKEYTFPWSCSRKSPLQDCLQEVIFIYYLFSIKQFEPFILQIYNFRHYSDSIHVTNLE